MSRPGSGGCGAALVLALALAAAEAGRAAPAPAPAPLPSPGAANAAACLVPFLPAICSSFKPAADCSDEAWEGTWLDNTPNLPVFAAAGCKSELREIAMIDGQLTITTFDTPIDDADPDSNCSRNITFTPPIPEGSVYSGDGRFTFVATPGTVDVSLFAQDLPAIVEVPVIMFATNVEYEQVYHPTWGPTVESDCNNFWWPTCPNLLGRCV